MNKLLFLCISLAILVFSAIVVNIAPAINKVSPDLFYWDYWSNYACKSISDEYNSLKNTLDKKEKDEYTKSKNRCDRRQAMIGMEYVTSNLNIIFGFICAFSGFLVYQNIGNLGNDIKYIGLIGLGFGVVGFVLTLVYVIESGLVFNDIADGEITKIDSDGAVLEWKNNKYTCIFYDKDDKDSLYMKYSDFGNKYLRYTKKMYYANEEKEYKYNKEPFGCRLNSDPIDFEDCQKAENGEHTFFSTQLKYYDTSNPSTEKGNCDKLFYFDNTQNSKYKILYDRWLTTIILSCFIMLLYIGLAIFGFLLFNSSGSSSGTPVAVK